MSDKPSYTPEQQRVINSSAAVLAVDAFAGTGKTSTLDGFAAARPRAKILYIAFNRSIAMAAKARFPQHVECRTTHSIAYAAVGRKYADKLGNPSPYEVAMRMNTNNRRAKQALETVNAWLCSVDPTIDDHHVPDQEDDPQMRSALLELARSIWTEMSNLNSPIKMPHDGYLKLWAMSRPKLRYDYILLDEAQDTNPLTLDLVMAQRPHAKLVLVGDRHQGIYGFRQAVNAMEEVDADERIAITRSFRFGSGIAELASVILHDYKSEQNAIRGRDDIEVSWRVNRRQPFTILSRTNAALFGELARLVTGKPPVKTVHYVGGFEGYFFGKVLDAFYLWADERRSIKDESIARFPDFAGFKQYGEEADDPEVKALVKVVEQYQNDVPSIYNALKAAETPADRAAVTVATAHKSKGLEWEQVVLTDDFISLPPEDDEYDAEEVNLLYVAITRAIRVLEPTASVKALIDDIATAKQEEYVAASGFAADLVSAYEQTWRQCDDAERNPDSTPEQRARLWGRLEGLFWVAEQMAVRVSPILVAR
ncbi:UvrD-helicase domain-containing protein [Burkholderia gladioli]|uniref:UvrD-helicase domain-containing protein n=1 Tax=Burkholderia gladioli TaxID=28095 RepID=UPI001641DC49|nr:UvrD-helicase domain-containing protein [Burkholderia gladioli]